MKGLRLYKKEKLTSATAIDTLFGHGSDARHALSYPLRAVWRSNPQRRSDAPIAFVISVPKKRLRHAVDRVAMRRRIRESYRLSRAGHTLPAGSRIDVAFVYVASRCHGYDDIDRAVNRLLEKIVQSTSPSAHEDVQGA